MSKFILVGAGSAFPKIADLHDISFTDAAVTTGEYGRGFQFVVVFKSGFKTTLEYSRLEKAKLDLSILVEALTGVISYENP